MPTVGNIQNDLVGSGFSPLQTQVLTTGNRFAINTTDSANNVTGLVNSGTLALPPPPTNVIATAGNASATVQFLNNHAGAPTSYIITSSPGGITTTVTPTTVNVSATVAGLSNGTSYTFTVQAVNNVGTGRASTASNAVTPTALPSSVLPVTRGLEFWWSAGQATSPGNGNPLTSLVDFSGNGYNFAGQGTGSGGAWVTSWSGGKPAVALNGSNQYYHALGTGYYPGMRGPDMTVYVLGSVTTHQTGGSGVGYFISACRPDALAGILARGFSIAEIAPTSTGFRPTVYDNLPDYTTGTGTVTGTDIALATPTRLVVVTTNASGAIGKMRAQAADLTGAIGPRLNAGAGNQPWSIGSMYGGAFGRYLIGNIAEVVIFAAAHTSAEITLMETYLATRF